MSDSTIVVPTMGDAAVQGLRERRPQISPGAPPLRESTKTSAQDTVRELNAREAQAGKDEKQRKTYGRTPDGTVFLVPYTEDMVSQLFNPTKPKVALDGIIVFALVSQILLMYFLPQAWRVPVFAVIFLFWRACYNFGIGWLLHHQSHHQRLVKWARKTNIFSKPLCDNPSNKGEPQCDNSDKSLRNTRLHSFLFHFLKHDMETVIPADYVFEDAPIEYNTWLLFRRVVDLILMSDFTSFCLFAIANAHVPAGEHFTMTLARAAGGVALILFNLWVKLDAHRVVKDYAWFWGDFFFLVDQELTFDGVFELAPHPMYSIGYVGFYGIALIAASYNVLFIAIAAHAAQLTFLAVVENPHIDRTYNAPPTPLKRPEQSLNSPTLTSSSPPRKARRISVPGHVNDYPPLASSSSPSPVHHLLGLHNLDLLRVTDVAVLLLSLYMATIFILTPRSSALWQTFFLLNALVWRLWYSLGLGIILDLQARNGGKWWTRHFVKYGESTEEAWRQWKGLYHLSMVMCYTSFLCAAGKMYGLPSDWNYGGVTLRHVLGAGLIALQCWTSRSIYESLGEFGWFYGDFFFEKGGDSRLTYSGIYRYLNNPERTIGLAGIWGIALITWSRAIFCLALLSHALTLGFIQFVEKPHLQKLYREQVRGMSGVSRSLRKMPLPPSLREFWIGQVDRVLDEMGEGLEQFVEREGGRLVDGWKTFAREYLSSTAAENVLARVGTVRLRPEIAAAGNKPKEYSLKIVAGGDGNCEADYESDRDLVPSATTATTIPYGTSIRVRWTAPLNHSKRDWIGLYAVGANPSREITSARSQGRWIGTNMSSDDDSNDSTALPSKGQSEINGEILLSDHHISAGSKKAVDGMREGLLEGEVEFSGEKLFWREGVFEIRYHHDGGYSVMAISAPVEIKIRRFEEVCAESQQAIAITGPDTLTGGEMRSKRSLAASITSPSRTAVEKALLPLVQACFDAFSSSSKISDLAPRTVDESFFYSDAPSVLQNDVTGEYVPQSVSPPVPTVPPATQAKISRRVVYAVRAMFGIEFAAGVVIADGNVKNLAWRVCMAKKVLRAYAGGEEDSGDEQEEDE